MQLFSFVALLQGHNDTAAHTQNQKSSRSHQEKLAEEIGAQRRTVAQWELGMHQPRGANLKALIELEKRAKNKK